MRTGKGNETISFLYARLLYRVLGSESTFTDVAYRERESDRDPTDNYITSENDRTSLDMTTLCAYALIVSCFKLQ